MLLLSTIHLHILQPRALHFQLWLYCFDHDIYNVPGKNLCTADTHKPLVLLLSTIHLHILPPRALHFQLWLNCFDHDIYNVPGKNLCTADTLSRAPVAEPEPNSMYFRMSLKFICTLLLHHYLQVVPLERVLRQTERGSRVFSYSHAVIVQPNGQMCRYAFQPTYV